MKMHRTKLWLVPCLFVLMFPNLLHAGGQSCPGIRPPVIHHDSMGKQLREIPSLGNFVIFCLNNDSLVMKKGYEKIKIDSLPQIEPIITVEAKNVKGKKDWLSAGHYSFRLEIDSSARYEKVDRLIAELNHNGIHQVSVLVTGVAGKPMSLDMVFPDNLPKVKSFDATVYGERYATNYNPPELPKTGPPMPPPPIPPPYLPDLYVSKDNRGKKSYVHQLGYFMHQLLLDGQKFDSKKLEAYIGDTEKTHYFMLSVDYGGTFSELISTLEILQAAQYKVTADYTKTPKKLKKKQLTKENMILVPGVILDLAEQEYLLELLRTKY